MSYSAETLSGTKYLSIQKAQEESKLSHEELKRAMALGFVSVIEVGTAKFVERSSLREYIAAQEEKAAALENPVPKPSTSENYIDTKEKAVFGEALAREQAIQRRPNFLPALTVTLVALVALVLAMPLPGEVGNSRTSAVSRIVPEEARNATADYIRSMTTYTSEREGDISASVANTQAAAGLQGFIQGVAIEVYEAVSRVGN